MNRQSLVLQVLTHDLHPDREMRLVRDPSAFWLEGHLGGFAPTCTVSEGSFYAVCPDRVVDVGRHLEHDEFVRFCEAIRSWQRNSRLHFRLIRDPELVVMVFRDEHPEGYDVLRAVEERNDFDDDVAFFGADIRR